MVQEKKQGLSIMPRGIQKVKGNKCKRKSSPSGVLAWYSILTCSVIFDKFGKSIFKAQIVEEILEILEKFRKCNYDDYSLNGISYL